MTFAKEQSRFIDILQIKYLLFSSHILLRHSAIFTSNTLDCPHSCSSSCSCCCCCCCCCSPHYNYYNYNYKYNEKTKTVLQPQTKPQSPRHTLHILTPVCPVTSTLHLIHSQHRPVTVTCLVPLTHNIVSSLYPTTTVMCADCLTQCELDSARGMACRHIEWTSVKQTG